MFRIAQNLRVARSNMLDADRGPVQTDGVTADERESHKLIDRAVPVDDELGAGPGFSPSSGSDASDAKVAQVAAKDSLPV